MIKQIKLFAFAMQAIKMSNQMPYTERAKNVKKRSASPLIGLNKEISHSVSDQDSLMISSHYVYELGLIYKSIPSTL